MTSESDVDEAAELSIFQEYIRIPTVHPNIDYGPCIEFLKAQADDLELPYRIYRPVNEQNPIFIITKLGMDPSAPSIMLNSYMDAESLPFEEAQHDYFGADMDDVGNIYGHGTQSTKAIGMLYLAALRLLIKNNESMKRNIHVVFSPDKENGGEAGLREFVKSKDFTDMDVGFCLDEGSSSPGENIPVFNAERCLWRVTMEIPGPTDHSSVLLKNTAAEKLQTMLNRINEWRYQNIAFLDKHQHVRVGEVNALNVTRITGGALETTIPHSFTLAFDVYFTPADDPKKFEAKLEKWRLQSAEDIQINFDYKGVIAGPTTTDQSNLFWMAFQNATNVLNLDIDMQINPSAKNSNFLREAGVPTLGFSPLNNTPPITENPQEYVNAETYLNGIHIYKKILMKLGNASKCYCKYKKKDEKA